MQNDPRLQPALRDFDRLLGAWSAALAQPVTIGAADLTRSPRAPQPSPQISRNGSAQLLRCKDGWLALNLPRPADLELIPALVGRDLPPGSWRAALTAHARGMSAADLHSMACLLGLAAALPSEARPAAPLCLPQGPLSTPKTAPLVLDLSALWAGPLCGALLARAGCQVIKLELTSRPDTTAVSDPVLHQRLNGAKAALRLDLQKAEDRRRFAALLDRADLLITSARPQPLQALVGDWHPARPWIAICAYDSDRSRIGFGDDCAIAGGLYSGGAQAPGFLGDAIADPLTGLYAATRACQALARGEGGAIPVGLAQVAARVAAGGLIA